MDVTSGAMPTSAIPKVKGVVDIIFLIDATGSMSPEIEAVKKHVGNFLDSLKHPKNPNAVPIKDWRAAVYAYRDHDYDTAHGLPWFISNPFSRDPNEVKRQLNEIQAAGGGPEPESLLDALLKISQMPAMEKGIQMSEEDPNMWRYRSSAARAVIVFTDATFHEEIPSSPGATMEDVQNSINSSRIRLYIFAPGFNDFDRYQDLEQVCDKAIYNAVPLNGLTPIEALATYMSDDANFGRTLEGLAKTVTQTAREETLVDDLSSDLISDAPAIPDVSPIEGDVPAVETAAETTVDLGI